MVHVVFLAKKSVLKRTSTFRNVRGRGRTQEKQKQKADKEKAEHDKSEKGISVLNDISIAMDNTEVFCFVKYYDKLVHGEMLCRFVMLKTYTVDEIKVFTQNTTPEVAPTTSLGSPTDEAVSGDVPLSAASSSKEHAAETPFFTPSTKRILEELNQECIPPQSSTSPGPAVKRTITFGTITDTDLAGTSPLPDSDVNKVIESPKKKNKGQHKNA